MKRIYFGLNIFIQLFDKPSNAVMEHKKRPPEAALKICIFAVN